MCFWLSNKRPVGRFVPGRDGGHRIHRRNNRSKFEKVKISRLTGHLNLLQNQPGFFIFWTFLKAVYNNVCKINALWIKARKTKYGIKRTFFRREGVGWRIFA